MPSATSSRAQGGGIKTGTWCALIAFHCAYLPAGAVSQQPPPDDDIPIEVYRELPIEALLEIELVPVVTVEGVERPWLRTPSAIYVISAEDIRRSGHRSLSEVLRLVPGMHVGQINASQWAVSARGFNSRFANKLLVLIDGRTVYDPLFSGTFWESIDVVLEDLDRIEVIRGPGATLWGANAVNGVVNVITRSAEETQGLLLVGGGGTYERAFGTVRYGAAISDDAWFRVWAKYNRRAALQDIFSRSAHDDWDMLRGGFRFDARTDVDTTFTLTGDVYHSDSIGEAINRPAAPPPLFGFDRVIGEGRARGGHFLARLAQQRATGDGWSIKAYYDRRDMRGVDNFEFHRDTFDVEFRHHFQPIDRHDLIWGVGFRHSADRTYANDFLALDPAHRSINTVSGFIQDTITLVEDQWFFMLGTKLEHNSFTGFEYQPGGRLWWTPDDRQMIWGAISRPVRVPSRAAQDLMLTSAFAPTPPFPPDTPLVTIEGDRDVRSEKLLAFELGYRIQPGEKLSLDIATFYNRYRDVIALPSPIGPGANEFNNTGRAHSYGGEAVVRWRPADNWRLEGTYAFLHLDVTGNVFDDPARSSPRHMGRISSYLNITDDLEFNSVLYLVDRAPAQGAAGYARLDLGVTWRPHPNFELAVWGMNLLQRRHREFNEPLFLAAPVEIERSVYVQGTIRY